MFEIQLQASESSPSLGRRPPGAVVEMRRGLPQARAWPPLRGCSSSGLVKLFAVSPVRAALHEPGATPLAMGVGRLTRRLAPAIAEGWKPTAKRAKPAEAGSHRHTRQQGSSHAFRVGQPCSSRATEPETRLRLSVKNSEPALRSPVLRAFFHSAGGFEPPAVRISARTDVQTPAPGATPLALPAANAAHNRSGASA